MAAVLIRLIAAIAGPLTDDAELRDGLVTLIDAHAPVASGDTA